MSHVDAKVASAEFEQQLRPLRDKLSLVESEETWDDILRAITRLSQMSKSSASNLSRDLVAAVRSLARPLTSAMHSERTRLSGVAVEFLQTLSEVLGREFEPLLPLFMPALLLLCARTNKVFVSRARASITAIIEHTQSPHILPYFVDNVNDKSVSLRLAVAESVLACLNSFNPPDLEKEARAREVETIIRTAATDANADVRKAARKVFEAYKILLPGRVASFTGPLTPIIKKYLDVKASVPIQSRSNPPSRPQSSQSMHSLPAAPVRPKFSSSTSSIHATTSTTSLASHNPSHARSASNVASTAPAARRTRAATNPSSSHPDVARGPPKPPVRIAHTGATDMPPPDYIPVRVPQSKSAPIHDVRIFRSASACSVVVPRGQSPSGDEPSPAGPSMDRRPSKAEVGTSGATRPLPSHAPSRTKIGPIRPTSEDSNQDYGKERVVGGARRVPLMRPPVAAASAAISTTTSREDEAKERAAAVTIRVQPCAPSSDECSPPSVALQQDSEAKTSQQPTDRTKSKPTVQGKIVATKPPSQAGTKPTWGRPTSKPSRGTNTVRTTGKKPNPQKKVPVPTTAQARSSQRAVQPEATPLPPSPGEASAAVLIPLPPSPTVPPLDAIVEEPVTPERPLAAFHDYAAAQTPISALVASIEQGFLLSPSLPVSSPSQGTHYYVPLLLPETTRPLNAGNKILHNDHGEELINEGKEVFELASEEGRRAFADLQVNQC